jgi:hypothetical protein
VRVKRRKKRKLLGAEEPNTGAFRKRIGQHRAAVRGVMVRAISLEALAGRVPALDAVAAAFYKANCVVCLHEGGHGSGVTLSVDFTPAHESIFVLWEGVVTPQMLRVYADRNKRVDFGACAIALLLIPELTGYVAVEQSATGNGSDYFLRSPDADDDLIFNHGAYLEVSGIQTESEANSVDDRVQSKRRRLRRLASATLSTAADLPTYICVVEFSTPRAKVVIL